jgi:transposase
LNIKILNYRNFLYNCTKSATRFNPACKELYDRLRAKGKPYKVAIIAIAHKLLRQFFAIIKSGKPFAPTLHLAK